MQEKDQSILTITRCISIIIQIRKQINKPLAWLYESGSRPEETLGSNLDCKIDISNWPIRSIIQEDY
jgi:hypothetical protein